MLETISLILHCKTMYCCRRTFTEYIFHVGNVSETNSKVKSGLTAGGKSLKGERQSVFFTAVNPMDDDQSMEEVRCDLDKPRIAPYKNTWRPHKNTVRWCDLKLAQKKGLQFYRTQSYALVFYNTLPATCIEKDVCMKTNEEQKYRACQPTRFLRPMLKPNSQSGRQDHHDQDPQTTKAHREVTEKSAAATSTTEYQASHILQSKDRIRIAEKQTKS